MQDLRLIFGFGAAMGVVVLATSGCGKASAQEEPRAPERAIELTVYKEDFAMVSERRPVLLEGGHSKIVIDDVSKQLDPDSVLFDWPNANNHPDVIATTYNLGVGNGESLMSRLNGQQVDMMWPSTDGKAGEVVSGKLEAGQDGGGYALRTPDKLYVNPGGTIVASAKTASTLPQLSVELNSPATNKSQLRFSYLTRGMAWSADYVAKLNAVSNTAEIECWATIVNKTGIPFPAAKLTLMAGAPNRMASLHLDANTVTGGSSNGQMVHFLSHKANEQGRDVSGYVPPADANVNGGLATNVARASVGDLYAYSIPSTATIGIDQMNRVSMLGTRTVPIKRDYGIRIPTLTSWGYMNDDGATTRPHVPASVSLTFVNTKSSNLGIPLPAGAVRIYEKDAAGRERYTGADTINDTPKQEHVTLTMANAFDVYGSYKVVKSERIDKHKVRKTVETTLCNEKKVPVEVRVVQDINNRWWPVTESAKSEQLDPSTLQWKLPLKAGEQKKLTYTVDLRV